MQETRINLYSKIFIELLTDLSNLYPNDSSLSLFKLTVSGMVALGAKSFVFQVIEYLEPYSEQILKKDEHFFMGGLEEEFSSDPFISGEIKRIKDIWVNPDTTDNTKACIWKYFQNLVKLGKGIRRT